MRLSEMNSEDFLYRLDKINFGYGMYVITITVYSVWAQKYILLTISSIFVLFFIILNRNISRVQKEIMEAKKQCQTKKNNHLKQGEQLTKTQQTEKQELKR